MRLRSVLVMVLDQAERRDIVAKNVAKQTETPAGYEKARRSLTEEQARKLIEAVRGARLGAAYLVALMLGLRPGETLGLRWDDLDLDDGWVRVAQQLVVEGGSKATGQRRRLVFRDPKSESRRTIEAPDAVVAVLRVRRRAQLEERMKAGPAWVENGLVFTTEIGTPIDPRNYRRGFSKATTDAGLGHWHPHELRHSTVSLLSAAGVALEDISDMVGHKNTRVTQIVYRHKVSPTVGVGREPMERLFGDKLASRQRRAR